MKIKETKIVRTVARKLFPVLVLFAFYLIVYGHISPGGGFQGGVVLGSALILLCLSEGVEKAERKFKGLRLAMVESIGILTFIGIGFLGIILGHHFLGNFLPIGKAGMVPSAGSILLLNLSIGIKVGAGISLIFYALAKFRSDTDGK